MMSLPSIQLPSNNPPSPASTADSDAPRTPGEGSTEKGASGGSSANSKNSRKPSRRANTAERRATHNAVERQRRETLNGRFLDLAALLPNLSQIRRPSKSSIVNSSIAHVHASRRHRLLASRELRLMKMEADALRRELNEWRDRAGIPRVEEPQRGDGFGIVLSGELEVIVVPTGMDDEDDGDFAGYPDEDAADYPQEQPQQQFAPTHMRANVNIPGMQHHQMLPSPMIASPTSMPFENPAMGYAGPQPFYAQHPQAMLEDREREREKWFIAQQQQQQQQQMMNGRVSSRRPRSGSLSSGGTGSPPLTSSGYMPESARYGGGSPGSYEGPQPWMGAGGGGGGMNNAVFAMMM